jgi:hypothetical protein
VRGLADDTIELHVYEDHVTWVSYRLYFIFRKQVRRTVRYADIQRVVVRQGPRYATIALEHSHGQVMSISLAAIDAVVQAGLLVSDRIYRTHVDLLGLAADDRAALRQVLAALRDRGLLTDAYVHAKVQELN